MQRRAEGEGEGQMAAAEGRRRRYVRRCGGAGRGGEGTGRAATAARRRGLCEGAVHVRDQSSQCRGWQ